MTPNLKTRAKNLLALRHAERGTDLARYQHGAIALLQELIDAPEPEPVAYQVRNGWVNIALYERQIDAENYAKDQQKRHDLSGSLANFCVVPLYNSPPANNQSEQHLEMVNPPAPSVPDGWLEILEAVLREEIKNAEYIAAANPATVLALLDELDRLRNVESATLQGEKIGCRCTYADNQTVDTECLYHRAIRSERDRLRAELTAMRENLSDAAQCIANQAQTIARLLQIEKAASNLAKVKGRHNSELAMNQLLETLK